MKVPIFSMGKGINKLEMIKP